MCVADKSTIFNALKIDSSLSLLLNLLSEVWLHDWCSCRRPSTVGVLWSAKSGNEAIVKRPPAGAGEFNVPRSWLVTTSTMSVLKCPTLRQLRGYSICHPYVSVFVICTCQYLSSIHVSISHIHPIIICHIWSAFVFVDFIISPLTLYSSMTLIFSPMRPPQSWQELQAVRRAKWRLVLSLRVADDWSLHRELNHLSGASTSLTSDPTPRLNAAGRNAFSRLPCNFQLWCIRF